MADVQRHSVHTLVFRSLKRSHDMFLCEEGALPPLDEKAHKLRMAVKARDDYGSVMHLVQGGEGATRRTDSGGHKSADPASQQALVLAGGGGGSGAAGGGAANMQLTAAALKKPSIPKPQWHPPWKLYRVISGHTGWVRCVAFDPTNEWFCTGSNDRIIKIWDLASGKLKLSLTGHISGVRGLAVSKNHPYLFSCGEDKQVKCWDLEQNKVIRHYHGHLSGVYAIGLHPTIDNVLVTGGRDSTARVWDMRTKANIHVLAGHTNTVAALLVQASEPQVVTASHDSTIRLWDIVAGKTRVTLTHHKKSVRGLALHPTLNMFASGAPDNLKQWMCPDGKFIQNLSGHNTIVNCLAVNDDGVLVSGGDNGSLQFWDWKTGYNFQKLTTPVQPGSIDSEAGIFAAGFDLSGTRLVTCEADKTIKLFKEDDTATEESHPVNWKPEIIRRKKF